MAQPPKLTASKYHLFSLDSGSTSSFNLTVFEDMTYHVHPSAWISVAAQLGVMLLERMHGCDDKAGRSVKMDARLKGPASNSHELVNNSKGKWENNVNIHTILVHSKLLLSSYNSAEVITCGTWNWYFMSLKLKTSLQQIQQSAVSAVKPQLRTNVKISGLALGVEAHGVKLKGVPNCLYCPIKNYYFLFLTQQTKMSAMWCCLCVCVSCILCSAHSCPPKYNAL
jgi:hypothetical protein